MLIPPAANSPQESPGGDGYAAIANQKGTIKITGALADGRAVLACDSAGTIRMWPIGSSSAPPKQSSQISETHHAWKAHNDEIYKMIVCRSTGELITAGRDGVVNAWSLHRGEWFKDLRDLQADAEDFQFIPGTGRIATTDGQTVSIWDAKSQFQARLLGRVESKVCCLDVSLDGSTLVAGGLAGAIRRVAGQLPVAARTEKGERPEQAPADRDRRCRARSARGGFGPRALIG